MLEDFITDLRKALAARRSTDVAALIEAHGGGDAIRGRIVAVDAISRHVDELHAKYIAREDGEAEVRAPIRVTRDRVTEPHRVASYGRSR